jgi:hypothetical protein
MPTNSGELLIDTLQKWGALYGRKVSEKAIDVWMEIFVNTKPEILCEALQEVTAKAERMPTPGLLTKAIQTAQDKRPDLFSGVTYCHADPTCKVCYGTGFEIFNSGEHSKKAKRCKCWKEQPLEYKSDRTATHDRDGIPCVMDGKTGDVLYRAEDCEEGRECLALIRKLAKAKSVPEEKTPKQLKKERNRQVAALGQVE